MKVIHHLNSVIEVLPPGSRRDRDVPQYYVWGTDDSATRDRYWILDSTRDDREVAGPLDLATANGAVTQLNEAAEAIEAGELNSAQVELDSDDQPEPGRIYQITGTPDDRCLLTTGRWSDSVVRF